MQQQQQMQQQQATSSAGTWKKLKLDAVAMLKQKKIDKKIFL